MTFPELVARMVESDLAAQRSVLGQGVAAG